MGREVEGKREGWAERERDAFVLIAVEQSAV